MISMRSRRASFDSGILVGFLASNRDLRDIIMKIEFIGAARHVEHGSVLQDARVDGRPVICQFISEVLHECDPDRPFQRSLDRFESHRDRLLDIAARKISASPTPDHVVNIFTSDIFAHLPDFRHARQERSKSYA